MMQRSAILALVAGALVGAVGGFAAGVSLGPSDDLVKARNEGFEAGYAKAQQDINEIFVAKGLSYPLDYEIKDVYGYVKSVNGTTLVLEYDASQFTVFEKGMRTVTVDASGATVTKIVDAPEREVTEEDLGKMAPGGGDIVVTEGQAPPTGPQTIAQMLQAAEVSDIEVGDYVKVTAESSVRADGILLAKEILIYNLSHMQQGDQVPFTREFNGTGAPPGTEPSPQGSGPPPTPTGPPPDGMPTAPPSDTAGGAGESGGGGSGGLPAP